MRADFMEEQPSVKVSNYSNKLYIFISLNGEWVERCVNDADNTAKTQKIWECDYREIITTSDKINIEDVKANPENYLDWIEPADENDMGIRITECEAALLELASIIGG